MTIDEAIEKLLGTAYQGIVNHDKDYVNALQLSIEALKAVKKSRIVYSRASIYPLLGETNE